MGGHVSVMLTEAVDALNVREGGVYVDGIIILPILVRLHSTFVQV